MRTKVATILLTLLLPLSAVGNDDIYTITWSSPSKDAWGSMPLGNGELGVNAWVEPDGDLLLLLARTDAWSENARLLKLGRLRVTCQPPIFETGATFEQKLDVRTGRLEIRSAKDGRTAALTLWVDAKHPVVRVEGTFSTPSDITVDFEPWRTAPRTLAGKEKHSAYGLINGPDPIVVEPDTVLDGQNKRIVWFHRNERSIWAANLRLQALGDLTPSLQDPLLHRTFGAIVRGTGLSSTTDRRLQGRGLTALDLSIHPHTAITETADEWLSQAEAAQTAVDAIDPLRRRAAHDVWWKEFWKRHYIEITGDADALAVSRAYALQRYVSACAGRGAFPIKFNGSIFTVENVRSIAGIPAGYDPDYRRWGGPYWWQNTRLAYWPMLAAGDFEMMRPLFRMYAANLDLARERTKRYYGHRGAFFPETQYFWGTYTDDNYGRDRTGKPDGLTDNAYIRQYWSSGLELSMMMLDYHAHTGEAAFAADSLVPVVGEILRFFDEHWPRLAGKVRFDPAMSLETWHKAVNPLPEIVGIRAVATRMLALDESLTTPDQRAAWKRLLGELPPVPVRETKTGTVLSPAESFSDKKNSENPELYAVFPYRAYGLGQPDLDLAVRTFKARGVKGTGGWRQDAIKAAMLGLTDTAKSYVVSNAKSKHSGFRFPTMWGPNFDWIPDQDHGSVTMIALQKMLWQGEGGDDGGELLPAWPDGWDVRFKIHIPGGRTIEAAYKDKRLVSIDGWPVGSAPKTKP